MSGLATLSLDSRSRVRFCSNDGLGRIHQRSALEAGPVQEFQVFITGDRNLSFQQDIHSFNIVVVVLHAASNRLCDTELLMPKMLALLPEAPTGEILDIYP